jgi:hypothetical protein
VQDAHDQDVLALRDIDDQVRLVGVKPHRRAEPRPLAGHVRVVRQTLEGGDESLMVALGPIDAESRRTARVKSMMSWSARRVVL